MDSLTILGGGNTAFATAANLALRGYEVTLCEHPTFEWTLDPIRESKTIRLDGLAGRGSAKIGRITSDFEDALQNDLLLLIVPAYAHSVFAKACAPYLRDGHILVVLPGTLGSLEIVRVVRENGSNADVTVAETDTAPYVCRKVAPDAAHIWGIVGGLGLGVFPSNKTDSVVSVLSDIFIANGSSTIVPYSNVLECGLSAMNPVVHPPGVLMNAGRVEYSKGDFYFYEEGVTPGVCNAILAIDEERRGLGKAFGFDLIPVEEAFHRAGFGPKGDLWSVINGSRMLTQLRAPGALNTRWITEDVPYGLAAWCLIGEQFDVSTPLMQSIVDLASAVLLQDFWGSARTVRDLGIEGLSRDALLEWLRTGQV